MAATCWPLEIIDRVVALGLDTPRSTLADPDPILSDLDFAEQSFLHACALIGRQWYTAAHRRLYVRIALSTASAVEMLERTLRAGRCPADTSTADVVITLDFKLDRQAVAAAVRAKMEPCRPGCSARAPIDADEEAGAPIDVDQEAQALYVANEREVAEETDEVAGQTHLDFVVAAQRLVRSFASVARVQSSYSDDLTDVPDGSWRCRCIAVGQVRDRTGARDENRELALFVGMLERSVEVVDVRVERDREWANAPTTYRFALGERLRDRIESLELGSRGRGFIVASWIFRADLGEPAPNLTSLRLHVGALYLHQIAG